MKIWNWITGFGVSDQYPRENELVRLYNLMCILSGSGSLFIFFYAWATDFHEAYLGITLMIFSLYFIVLLTNSIGKIYTARYLLAIGSPIWISITNLFIGGNFSQSLAIVASMAITYVVFRKNRIVQKALLAFHVVIYFCSAVYINVYQPIYGIVDFPYDEITVFVVALGWIIIVLHKFNKDRSELVDHLRINNEELKSTTEELERFTYIASHDLKSPLRTIISFIGLIERDLKKGNHENISRNLNYVQTGAKQMNFLVQDILEFSKLKKHSQADRTLIDLNVVFDKVKFNLKEEIEEKNAIVSCESLPHFVGNELEFLMLFQNIIQNGIKYNESKRPTIIIASEQTNDSLRLSFADNGIGIEQKYYAQIFQFFKRLHNSEKYKGTGLGLGMCKKLVSNYGGQIEVTSEPDVGTTFTLVFPTSKEESVDNCVLETAEG